MWRVSFRVPVQALDEVLDGLLPALPGGVHVTEGQNEHELSLFVGDPPAERDVEALAGRPVAGWSQTPVAADGRVRRLGAGVHVGRIVVRPPSAPAPPEGAVDVVVEPHSVVFGSGSHPTTRMCLELLLGLAPDAGESAAGGAAGGLADLGCGLGTLAIAAAKLGWAPVVAVDREPGAVAATSEHAAANGVGVEASLLDLAESDPPWQPTLVLNAAPSVHARVAGRLPESVRTVILSSFVEAEEPDVLAPWTAAGLRVAARRTEDTWVALVLSRDARGGGSAPVADPGPATAPPPAAPPPAGDEPLRPREQVLDPAGPVAAGAALGQLATRLPDGGMVVSSSRTVEIGARAALVYVPGLFRFDLTPQHETLGVSLRAVVPVPVTWEADAETFDGFRRGTGEPIMFRGRFELPDGPLGVWIQVMTVSDDDQGAAHIIAKAAVRPVEAPAEAA